MRASAALRASVAPGGVLAGPWVRNELWRRARMMPSLDLPFADYKSLTDLVSGRELITFTRAFSGTFVGSDRVLQSAGVDIPRFTHDPVTGESLGLLSEGQRINEIRNSTMNGAAIGTPGTLPANWGITNTAGLTTNVAGVSIENGIPYIDLQITGTSTGTNYVIFYELTTQTTAAIGQTFTSSQYIKQVAGSTANISSISSRLRFGQAGGALTEIFDSAFTLPTVSPSFAGCRVESTATAANASTARVTSGVLLTLASVGVAINITLRIGLPQLEQGSGATSPVSTTTASVTRSADVIDLLNAAIANNIRTLYLEFRSPAVGTRGVVSLNDNTANERASVITSGTDPRLVVHDGGVEQASINGGTVVANARTRVAVRIDTNSFAISINGGPVITDSSGTLPTVDRLMIGRTQAGEYLNGPIARLAGWEQPLPDSALRALAC
jgi:hypothetical protein